jgi:hypothetical protein
MGYSMGTAVSSLVEKQWTAFGTAPHQQHAAEDPAPGKFLTKARCEFQKSGSNFFSLPQKIL